MIEKPKTEEVKAEEQEIDIKPQEGEIEFEKENVEESDDIIYLLDKNLGAQSDYISKEGKKSAKESWDREENFAPLKKEKWTVPCNIICKIS